MIDPVALLRRYERLAEQLRLLMEGPTQSLSPRTSHGKQEAKAPPGVKLDRKRFHPDHDPLLLCFLQRWNEAEDNHRRIAVLAEYEVRLDKRRQPHDGRVAGGTLDGDVVEITPDDVLARDERIVTEYEGLLPVEVASIETEGWGWCGEANVRKVRRHARRDPETGRLQEGMDDDRTYAVALKRDGDSIKEIADKLGRPKSTIQYWLAPGAEAA